MKRGRKWIQPKNGKNVNWDSISVLLGISGKENGALNVTVLCIIYHYIILFSII